MIDVRLDRRSNAVSSAIGWFDGATLGLVATTVTVLALASIALLALTGPN
jgi:hypothetical protein